MVHAWHIGAIYIRCVHISPAPNGSFALQLFEQDNAVEISNGIMFEFYACVASYQATWEEGKVAPVYGDRRCMLSSCQSPVESTHTMIDHFIKEHQEITPFPDADKLLSEICLSPDSLFNLGQSLLSAMHPDF